MKCRNENCHNVKAPDRAECHSCRGKRRRGTENPLTVRSFSVAETNLKILLIDIETSPNITYSWGLYKQNIGVNQIIKTGDVMCFSAKWLGDSDTVFFSEWEEGREKMVQSAWNLLNEADAVIHYFGSQFDIPWLYRSFLESGLTPPSPFKQIDLKFVMSKNFKFTSNKLQHISTELGLEGKIETGGFDLWADCIARDPDALSLMEEYNRRDVDLLEELYLILLPWIQNLPHKHLFDGAGNCPSCGANSMIEDGIAYTNLSRYVQWKCESCGSFFRSTRRIDGVSIQQITR
jgi:uncharacterized protein